MNDTNYNHGVMYGHPYPVPDKHNTIHCNKYGYVIGVDTYRGPMYYVLNKDQRAYYASGNLSDALLTFNNLCQ